MIWLCIYKSCTLYLPVSLCSLSARWWYSCLLRMVQNVWKDPFLALSRMWSNSSTCSSFSGSFSRHSYCRYGSSERRSGMMDFTSMSLWRSEWHLRSAFFSLSSIRALILARCTVYLTKYTFSSYGGGCLGLYIMLDVLSNIFIVDLPLRKSVILATTTV